MSESKIPEGEIPEAIVNPDEEGDEGGFVMNGIRYGPIGAIRRTDDPVRREQEDERYRRITADFEELIGQKRAESSVTVPSPHGIRVTERYRDRVGDDYRVTYTLEPPHNEASEEPTPFERVDASSSGLHKREGWTLGEQRPGGTYFLQYRRETYTEEGGREQLQPNEWRKFDPDEGGEVMAYEPADQKSPDTIARFEELLYVIKNGQRVDPPSG